MGKKIDNPFVVSGYVSPEFFCDRKSEALSLKSYLENGNNVTLVSPRRMGKTGLIHHVFNQIRHDDSDAMIIYVDLMPTGSLADFARVFSVALMEKLDSTPMKILKKATSVLSRVRPTMTFDPVSGDPKISVDIAPGEEYTTVEHLLDYIAGCGKRCFVAFDEFQQITQYPETNVEAILRSKIQQINNANFVFSGSKMHMLSEMFLSAKRPFYASTSFQQIGPIVSEAYYAFASAFFRESGRELTEDAFKSLYDHFDGHTWYIQKVLNKLFSQSVDSVDQIGVVKAVNEILSENEFYYQSLLRAYSKGQGKLLRAIAKEGRVKEILSGGFIAKHGLNATSSVRGSLAKLLEDEQVYKDAEGYMVYDRFMAEWLKNL